MQTFAAPALMVEDEISGVEIGKDETATVRFGQHRVLAHPRPWRATAADGSSRASS